MRVYACHSYIKNAVFPRVQNPPALMSSRASGLVFVELRSKCSLSNGIRCGSASTLLQTLRCELVSRCWIPPCLSATNQTAFFTRDKAWLTEKADPRVQLLGRSSKGRLWPIRSESLNSCLLRASRPCSRGGNEVSSKLAQMSFAWFTEGRGSDGSISSMWSILDLWEAAFSDCCAFFIYSGVSGKHELCSIIERTWGSVISLETAYCCGACSLSRGIPKPPLARGSVITSCNLSVYGSNWPNKVGRSISWITSSIGSV